MGLMPQSEREHNSVKYSQNVMKGQSGHLHYASKQYAWYRDPSSSSSPDILLTRLLYYTKCQSRKRDIIQPYIYGILSKLKQVFAQSDQRLCCSLPRQYNISSFYIRNFKAPASFCGCWGRFESYLVANPEDRFSRDEALIKKDFLTSLSVSE